MSWDRWWLLPLLLLPLAWAWWEAGRNSQRLPVWLKAASFALILLAMAGPNLEVNETKLAVGILVDTSLSVSRDDLRRAAETTSDILSSRGRHWVQVLPFARGIRALDEAELRSKEFRYTSGEDGSASNPEGAIREALAALPAGLVPRLVLISDGLENAGSLTRAAWQARQLGIPIDTYALKGKPRPQLALDSVNVPGLAFAGEKFPIEVVVSSPRRGSASFELTAEGRVLAKTDLPLEAGQSTLAIRTSLDTTGSLAISGRISGGELGELTFTRAVTLRRAKVLMITSEPPDSQNHLSRVLQQSLFDLEFSPVWTTANLARYQTVVFNNWDLEAIPLASQEQLEEYVKQGGSLLVIGGERNIYREKKEGAPETALERTLPAKLAPPRSPQGTCVVLIVDKSSSMEGKKMELARIAAMGVIDNLRPIDLVGVLIFDNSFQWTVPIRRAQNPAAIKRLIAGIMADGGTQIAPALAEAYRRSLPVNAIYKHVILLTDGISEEGDSLNLAREANLNRITISTVGLGQDVNRAYLEKVAALSGGKSYFLIDPSGLEQILVRDVMEHTGSTAVEEPVRAVITRQSEVLADTSMETAPPLLGYVKFTARPSADTVLRLSRDEDPLYTRWQYNLGRAAVFASDAKNRWASDWVSWKGFDTFWANVFRDLLPRARSEEAAVEYDSVNDRFRITYRLARYTPEPRTIPEVFAIGPGEFRRPVPIARIASGVYQGQAPAEGRRGFFRFRPLAETAAFPEIGFYREEEELTEFGSNQELLRQVASFTGGRFEPDPRAVFSGSGRSVPGSLRLWPGLLALAILVNLTELFIRKVLR